MFNRKLKRQIRGLESETIFYHKIIKELFKRQEDQFKDIKKLKENLADLSDEVQDIPILEEELKKIKEVQDKRWKMLKKYLGVEEKEYADLENESTKLEKDDMKGYYNIEVFMGKRFGSNTKAIKKTKLVKKSNKKK